MNRRQFIRTGAAGLGAAALAFGQAGSSKPLRVGLIGCGWYGKCDLFRLIQVSPGRGGLSLRRGPPHAFRSRRPGESTRQASHKKPAHLQRLSRDARREGSRYRPHRYSRPLARPAHDRRRQSRRRCLLSETDQRGRRGRPGDARCRPQVQPRRADRHAAAQHAPPDRSARPDRAGGQARQGRAGGDLLLLPHAQ